MPRKTWDDFVQAHARAICVSAHVTWKVPAGQLAADGRKLPTARDMLIASLNPVLQGDWSVRIFPGPSSKVGGKKQRTSVIQIVLESAGDLAVFQQQMFRVSQVQGTQLAAPCAVAHQFVYEMADYRRLAKALGYA